MAQIQALEKSANAPVDENIMCTRVEKKPVWQGLDDDNNPELDISDEDQMDDESALSDEEEEEQTPA